MSTSDLVRLADNGKRLLFYCRGCDEIHAIVIDGTRGWSWNNDTQKPTVTTSVLSVWTNRTTNERRTCHLFIENGNLRFLGDCTHEYKDVIIPMDPFNKFFEGETMSTETI